MYQYVKVLMLLRWHHGTKFEVGGVRVWVYKEMEERGGVGDWKRKILTSYGKWQKNYDNIKNCRHGTAFDAFIIYYMHNILMHVSFNNLSFILGMFLKSVLAPWGAVADGFGPHWWPTMKSSFATCLIL